MVSESDLKKLYSDLKNGSSNGIVIDGLNLYNAGLNQGFAKKGITQAYGRKMSIMLNADGAKYDTYEQFKNRNNLTNSININAPIIGSQIGQSSDFRDLSNKFTIESTTKVVKETINQKSKFDIKIVLQYAAWIAGITSAILACWKYFSNT